MSSTRKIKRFKVKKHSGRVTRFERSVAKDVAAFNWAYCRTEGCYTILVEHQGAWMALTPDPKVTPICKNCRAGIEDAGMKVQLEALDALQQMKARIMEQLGQVVLG